MKEKKYTLEAWICAYEAIEQHINYMRSDWIDGEYVQDGKTEFTDDEKLEMQAYQNVLKAIEKMA